MRRSRSSLVAAILLCFAAIALGALPERVGQRIRMAVYEAAMPGHRAVQWIERHVTTNLRSLSLGGEAEQRDREMQKELAALRLSYRRLLLANASLRERLESGDASGSAARREPLLNAELLEANVLTPQSIAYLRSELLADRGAASGTEESALVLEATTPLIDQGSSGGIGPDQPVDAGRAVVGRIDQAGREVSTIRLVTDARYSDLVQVGRSTSEGTRFYARGILRGQGSRLCRLDNVPATQPVSVGDEVYSLPADETISQPVYYGKVARAELEDGDASWRILVEPAALDSDLRTVRVLRRRINPQRLLAN